MAGSAGAAEPDNEFFAAPSAGMRNQKRGIKMCNFMGIYWVVRIPINGIIHVEIKTWR